VIGMDNLLKETPMNVIASEQVKQKRTETIKALELDAFTYSYFFLEWSGQDLNDKQFDPTGDQINYEYLMEQILEKTLHYFDMPPVRDNICFMGLSEIGLLAEHLKKYHKTYLAEYSHRMIH
jgi:hypothetical protein